MIKDKDYKLMRGGRVCWKIENETFNTLKNQGYHFGHNYGLGKKNLRAVFAMLIMLAFLVDQTQQISCPLFRGVWDKLGSKRELWERMRSIKNHWDGILEWKRSQINNGLLEGLNSIVQAVKAKARGFRTFRNFGIVVFLLTGDLNFKVLNPNVTIK